MSVTEPRTIADDIIPEALVAELRQHLETYDIERAGARQAINEAVDMGQLVAGLERRDRSTRFFTRLVFLAEGASLALGLEAGAGWDAAVSR